MSKYKKMSEKELVNLINSTEDPEVLELAEAEYLRRMDTDLDSDDSTLLSGFDDLNEYEEQYIDRYWRQS